MPLYEYHCANCQATFEKRRLMSQADEATACPHCGDTHASRGLSRCAAFSKGSDGTSQAVSGSGGCAGCAAHSCASCSHH
ncbi:MAG: zinc ribbon domain-containing protein [Anaerolineae bacterium]|nr:zinc ribbon domain-containing protein [Anaerolineae bacterium]